MAGIDTYTKLMLHCDGDDGSTTFTDSEIAPTKTVTANGNAQIDTAQSKFGGASGLLDGTTDYLSTPDHVDFAFGSGDYTIDFWVRFSSVTNAEYQYLVNCDNGGAQANQREWLLSFYNNGTNLLFYRWNTANELIAMDRVVNFAINTWYHIAVTRSGSDVRMFINGTQNGATDTDSAAYRDNGSPLYVGSGYSAGSYCMAGWVEEIRVSKGIARWTADFTPPTEAYTLENTVPHTPTNSTPANATTGQAVNPTLTSSAYVDDENDPHYSSQWQIAFANDFTNKIVWDSGTTLTNLVSVVVNSTNGTFSGGLNGLTALQKGIPYHWRVRYNDNVTGWSSWSTPTYFVVLNPVGKGLVLNPLTGKFDKIKEYPFITSASLYQMPASTDTNASNNSFYWSLTQNALAYKDGDSNIYTIDLTAI